MKDWVKEICLGVALFLIGAGLTVYWLDEVVIIIKGLLGPIILILGILLLWIGLEDKKLEKELKEIEKELKEEENKEEKK